MRHVPKFRLENDDDVHRIFPNLSENGLAQKATSDIARMLMRANQNGILSISIIDRTY